MITIVSGLPRSGTSLMMQMLEAGGLQMMTDGLREADANNPKGYLEFEKVKQLRKDNAWMGDAEGKTIKVVSHLLQSCPAQFDYQIVFMVRNLDEVVASQEAMIKRLGKDVPPAKPEQVKELFQKHLTHIRHWLATQGNMRVLYVDHRELMSNPGPVAEQINAFLGGRLDVAKMTACVDPSLHRERAK